MDYQRNLSAIASHCCLLQPPNCDGENGHTWDDCMIKTTIEEDNLSDADADFFACLKERSRRR